MKIIFEIEQFVDYVNSFYGIGGIYPLYNGRHRAHMVEIKQACNIYITRIMNREIEEQTWGGGDSLDRERVRYILAEMGYEEKKLKKC